MRSFVSVVIRVINASASHISVCVGSYTLMHTFHRVFKVCIALCNMTTPTIMMQNETPLFQLQRLQLRELAVDIHHIEVKIENNGRQTIPNINSLFRVAACSIDNIIHVELDQFLNEKPYVFYLKGIGLFSWRRLNIKTKNRDGIQKSIKEAISLIEQTCLQYISRNGDEIGCQLNIVVNRE